MTAQSGTPSQPAGTSSVMAIDGTAPNGRMRYVPGASGPSTDVASAAVVGDPTDEAGDAPAVVGVPGATDGSGTAGEPRSALMPKKPATARTATAAATRGVDFMT